MGFVKDADVSLCFGVLELLHSLFFFLYIHLLIRRDLCNDLSAASKVHHRNTPTSTSTPSICLI